MNTKEKIFDKQTCVRVPTADVFETTDSFVIYVNLPGISKESVKITYDKNTLIVEAERKPSPSEGNFIHREIRYGRFYRGFKLSDGVDSAKFFAEMNDGVLTLTLPKSEKNSPKIININ